jgi:predicted nuclease of predicted toxin-antitoxin system
VKFLVDNQLPAALARWLAAKGHDAIHVLDRGLGRESDVELWKLANDEGRILVSKDEDFLALALRPGDKGRLLWLRLGNCRKQALLDAFEGSWLAIAEALEDGQQVVEVRSPASSA